MFSVYADGELLYAPNATSIGYVISSPKLTMEVNKAGSFEFNIPPTNPVYSKLQRLKTIITIEDDTVKASNKEIWRGRILNDKKNFYNLKQVFCEGELAFLNDAPVPPYNYSGGVTIQSWFRSIMNHYTETCSDFRKIQYGNFTAIDPSTKVYHKLDDYSDVMTELSDKLASSINGYFKIRRGANTGYLDFYDPTDNVSDQSIVFGKNLLDLTEYVNASEVYTSIIPLGKKDSNGKRVDITSVNGGSNFLTSSIGVSLFGVIRKPVAWEDTTDPQELKEKGQALLNKVIEMATTIEISAVDLTTLGVDVSRIEVGQFIHVESPPHGINSNFLCSKIVLDLQELSKSTYTFGLIFNALTDKQIENSKKSENAYEAAQNTSEEYNSLKTEIYQNYVSNAEFENYQGEVNKKFQDLGALNPDQYATKEDLRNLDNVYLSLLVAEETYTKLEEFKKLEERVVKLENGGA